MPTWASPSAAASRRRWPDARSTPTLSTAGVDTSDHEVNIKIATGGAIAGGALAATDRDALLFSMTDEVAGLVLRHNYQQSQAISMAEGQAVEEHDRLERFMRTLERKGRLDRAVEFLPDWRRCAYAPPTVSR